MEKIKYSILLIFLAFYGCEETLTDIEMPYVEQLVVSGRIEAGQKIKNIMVSKTFPPLSEPNIVYLSSANVSIESDGEIYPLAYSDIYYFSNEDLIPEEGKKYKLTVEWNGLKAFAETYIPVTPKIDSIRKISRYSSGEYYPYSYYYYICVSAGLQDTYMGMIANDKDKLLNKNYYYVVNDWTYYSSYYIYKKEHKDDAGVLNIPIFGIRTSDSDFSSYNLYDKPCAILESYDVAYYDFYQTKRNGEELDGFFSSGEKYVSWNVQGDGVGLFIGKSQKVFEFEF